MVKNIEKIVLSKKRKIERYVYLALVCLNIVLAYLTAHVNDSKLHRSAAIGLGVFFAFYLTQVLVDKPGFYNLSTYKPSPDIMKKNANLAVRLYGWFFIIVLTLTWVKALLTK